MTRTLAAVALVVALAWQAFAWPLPFGLVTGNRVAQGIGTFPRWQALVLATDVPIKWIVALPLRRLAAVDRDGALIIYEVIPGGLRVIARYGGAASPDGPPIAVRLDRDETGVALVAPDGRLLIWSDGALRGYDVGGRLSSLTFPIPVAVEGRASNDLLAIAQDGAVVLIGGLAAGGPRALARVDAHALRDGRITMADLDGDGIAEAVVLTAARPRALLDAPGDRPDATGLAVIRVRPYGLELWARLTLPAPLVFVDRVPILAPLGGSGRPAVLLARGAPGQGTTPVALALRDGGLALVAEGPSVDASHRQAQLLGSADLSADGVPEVVAVMTSPLDGVLTAYRKSGGLLAAVASAAGYGSRATGTRKGELGLIADLDGDGRPEVVVPRPSREILVGLDLRGERFVERWAIDFKSPITSNLVAADLDGDGLLDLAVAVRRGLHVFLSAR